jgi:hypothetical protein
VGPASSPARGRALGGTEAAGVYAWIQEQGGWSSAKILLDAYGHFMPSESRGYADQIAHENGSGTVPAVNRRR